MYLLWLRVAAILYAAASVAVFPAVLYGIASLEEDMRSPGRNGLFLPLRLGCRNAGPGPSLDAGHRQGNRISAGTCSRRVVLPGLVALRRNLAWHFCVACHILSGVCAGARCGPVHISFEGVRTNWLVAHIVALLIAYAALCFSLVASMLYLVQERRIKSKPEAGQGFLVGAPGLASAPRHPGTHLECDAGVWFSLHDGGTGDRLSSGAGDGPWRGLFPRPQGDRFFFSVGGSTSFFSSSGGVPACVGERLRISRARF